MKNNEDCFIDNGENLSLSIVPTCNCPVESKAEVIDRQEHEMDFQKYKIKYHITINHLPDCPRRKIVSKIITVI